MDYKKLLQWHRAYNHTEEDLIKSEGFEQVLEDVVIAPWWEHDIFENHAKSIEKVGKKLYKISGDNFEFSFIEMKNIGAPAIIEEILTLGVTKCKRLIFIGSAGAISDNINIGDLALPTCSISGVGVTRYLNENLEDDFEASYSPDEELSNQILETIKKEQLPVRCHHVKNYSVDTIFGQFPHIEHFKSIGCETIEMETSTVFKCASLAGIKATAIFCISDNSLQHKSLISGRSLEDKEKKNIAKTEFIPKIIISFFNKNCK